jgi:hypothetical protein
MLQPDKERGRTERNDVSGGAGRGASSRKAASGCLRDAIASKSAERYELMNPLDDKRRQCDLSDRTEMRAASNAMDLNSAAIVCMREEVSEPKHSQERHQGARDQPSLPTVFLHCFTDDNRATSIARERRDTALSRAGASRPNRGERHRPRDAFASAVANPTHRPVATRPGEWNGNGFAQSPMPCSGPAGSTAVNSSTKKDCPRHGEA